MRSCPIFGIPVTHRYIKFSKFEIRCHEISRARVIFKAGISSLKTNKDNLQSEYATFEKQYGNKDTIDDVIISKRKEQYEQLLEESPFNYDIWFDYLKMLEQEGNESSVIEAYEKAVKNVPPSKEKRFWRRWERLVGNDL
jgi:crooked neck